MRRVTAPLLFAIAMIGCGADGSDDSSDFDTRVLDLRGFERFRIDQTPFLGGGCPLQEFVDPAAIERVDENEYLLTFSIALSDEERTRCEEEPTHDDECNSGTPVPREPRTLDSAQLGQLMEMFSAVPVSFVPNPCEGFSDDPCRIVRLTWDDLETSDHLCESAEPWIDRRFVRDVLETVTALGRSHTN